MISEVSLTQQLKRLMRLPFHPTDPEGAKIVATEFARQLRHCVNDHHLSAVVDRLMDTCARIPAPAEVGQAVRDVEAPAIRTYDTARPWERPPCPFGECDGNGWAYAEHGGIGAVRPCRCRQAGAA